MYCDVRNARWPLAGLQEHSLLTIPQFMFGYKLHKTWITQVTRSFPLRGPDTVDV